MKPEKPNLDSRAPHGRRKVVQIGSSTAAAQQRRTRGLLGALLLSLPAIQAEANLPGSGTARAQETPPVPILDRVASIRERLGVASEQNPRLKAARDEALRLSTGPDWSDWYNRY